MSELIVFTNQNIVQVATKKLIIIINLIHIDQFDTKGTLTVLYTVIKYIQTQNMHIIMDIHETIIFIHIYLSVHIYTYTDTCTYINKIAYTHITNLPILLHLYVCVGIIICLYALCAISTPTPAL